jgi:hypothetical protein
MMANFKGGGMNNALLKCVNAKLDTIHTFIFRLASVCLTSFTLAAIVACSSSWSSADRQNAEHFFRALDAAQKATQLTNKAQPGVIQTGIEEILQYQRLALQEANFVHDSVLDKAHPQLRQHFRGEFEKGLELVIRSAEMGMASKVGPTSEQLNLAITGTTLLNEWIEWKNVHRLEIHIPETR